MAISEFGWYQNSTVGRLFGKGTFSAWSETMNEYWMIRVVRVKGELIVTDMVN